MDNIHFVKDTGKTSNVPGSMQVVTTKNGRKMV